MPRPQIVVADDHPSVFANSAASATLREFAELTVFSEPGAESEAELARRIGDAEGAINIRAYAKYTDSVLASCPNLKIISIWGTGTDNVDLAACERRGVTVRNTPGVNANAVAEHAITLMLNVLRKVSSMDADLRAGKWARAPLAQLEGKTVGVVGFGAIGRRVAKLASAFGATILVHTRTPDNGRVAASGARAVSLEELLRESDVVSLSLRLEAESTGFIGRERLATMKRSAILINTARGALVNKAALLDALSNGTIAGAGLDVFHEEPIPPGDPILSAPNVVLTPHVAGNTPEVIAAGLEKTVQNVKQFFGA
jgi:phosphoglycerate dehydrogenase-like enzyme